MSEDQFAAARERMVAEQIRARGVADPRVLAALRRVPRHRFIPEHLWSQAYADYPLPIGEDQTISQPYIVALMTEILELKETDRVLEVGTGSGYQAAILAELAAQVFSIDRKGGLADHARSILESLGYRNIRIRVGDGTLGWPEEAPFDGIIVTAGAPGPQAPGGATGPGGAPGDSGGGRLHPNPDLRAPDRGGVEVRIPRRLPLRAPYRQIWLGRRGDGGLIGLKAIAISREIRGWILN